VARAGYALPQPFMVLATQNPIEMEGTYPLPEAQLDRFLLKVLVQQPALDELARILDLTTGRETPRVDKVADAETVLRLRELARAVPLSEPVKSYAARLTLATRPSAQEAPDSVRRFVRYGASPRGAQALVLAGKVYALLAGRFSVGYEDVRRAAPAALRHRMILNFEGEAESVARDRLILEILEHVKE
jgi:MoxR-like ATPase